MYDDIVQLGREHRDKLEELPDLFRKRDRNERAAFRDLQTAQQAEQQAADAAAEQVRARKQALIEEIANGVATKSQNLSVELH